MAHRYPHLTRAASRAAVAVFLVLLVGILAAGCMTTTIRSGEAGVIYSRFGGTDLEHLFGEGLNVHAPWVDVILYDARVQEQHEEMEVLSSNGLNIGLEVSIRWRPVRDELPQLHTTYGRDYYRKVVQPVLRSASRDVVGKYTPEDLYSTRRSELQQQIFEQVQQGVAGRYIEIDAVLLRDVNLPEQIRRAIERKLEEEQEAERYEFTLEKERLEAERKRIEADGQAEYQRIITSSLSPTFLRYKGIEATQQLAQSPNSKTIIVGSGEDGLPIILGGQ